MKIVTPGLSKGARRVDCHRCLCVFDVTPKECTRYRVDMVHGHRYERKVKCPSCGHMLYEV